MLKIALVIPDSPFLFDPLGFPQLGPLYISAVIKKMGYDVDIFDLTGTMKPDLVVPELRDYTYIGITASSPQFPYAVQLMKGLRKYNSFASFIIGGPHAIVSPQTCYDAGFDIVVSGEGESVIPLILNNRVKTGIFYPQPIKDLDSLPWPDREAVDMSKYHFFVTGERTMHLMTQRGCPYACAFCCGREVKSYRWVRFFSDDYILDQMEFLRGRYGIRSFMFFDDEFNINKERTLRLCEQFKKMDIIWRCQVRSNLFDEEIAQAMSESGCKEVGCGVETGSMKIKKNINKKTTPEQDLQAVQLAHKYGMKFKCFIVVGLPGEDISTFNETREWIKLAQPDNFDYTVLMPYPGSPIWEHPERYDIQFDKEEIIRSNFSQTWYKGFDGGPARSLVRTAALSEEDIMTLRKALEKEFPRSPSTAWAGTEAPS